MHQGEHIKQSKYFEQSQNDYLNEIYLLEKLSEILECVCEMEYLEREILIAGVVK